MNKTFIYLAIILFVACGQSDEQQVSSLYNQALTLYESHRFDDAKNIIDTIHSKFPLLIGYRKKADTLLWHITINEIAEEMPHIDSILYSYTKKAELIAKNYTFHKDEKYQQLGDYEHNSVQNAYNINKTYLKPITDENGNFRLISNYVGSAIKHRQIAVRNGDSVSYSIRATDTDLNSYNDFGVNYELVSFNLSACQNIITVFEKNANNGAEIRLIGEKNYFYTIPNNSVRIILETYDFSKILKEIHKIQAKKANFTDIYNSLSIKLANR